MDIWKEKGITLACADFQKYPWSQHVDSVTAIITDPPYGRKYFYLYEDLGALAFDILVPRMGHLLTFLPSYELNLVLPRITKYGLRHWWTLAHIIPSPPYARIRELGAIVTWKPVGWFLKGKKKQSIGFRQDSYDAGPRQKGLHKWQQGIIWAKYLLENFTQPGDLIVDPMMGSGTIGAACVELERDFIGIDSDPVAYDTAQKRLSALIWELG